jgi:hypothetical protein
MGIHPKLSKFSKVKHIKAFSNLLKDIEKELAKVGCTDFYADIVSSGVPERSLMARLFRSRDYNQPEDTLVISTKVHGCLVEIIQPLTVGGIPMPYVIRVILPVPITRRAEYRVNRWGHSKWHCEPGDKEHLKDLEHSMPKISMVHPAGHIRYNIEIGSSLEPISGGKTEWMIHTGYEGTFSISPKIQKYLKAIPTVESMLRKWRN